MPFFVALSLSLAMSTGLSGAQIPDCCWWRWSGCSYRKSDLRRTSASAPFVWSAVKCVCGTVPWSVWCVSSKSLLNSTFKFNASIRSASAASRRLSDYLKRTNNKMVEASVLFIDCSSDAVWWGTTLWYSALLTAVRTNRLSDEGSIPLESLQLHTAEDLRGLRVV